MFTVLYATLVTLDGSQDGTEQHQLVSVPAHSLNLASLAELTGHGAIPVTDLQVSFSYQYKYCIIFNFTF